MKGKILILGLLVTALLYSCGSDVKSNKPMPDWVNTPKKDTTYFFAVGYVEDVGVLEEVKEKALANAKTKIASMVFEEANVEKVFSASGVLNADEALKKTYQESVKTKSAGRITGVEVDDVYYEEADEGGMKVYRMWILAKLPYADIQKERNRVLEEMKRNLELVDKNIREAQSYLDSGNVVDAVKSYLSAAVSSTKVESRSDEFIVYINEATKIISGIIIESVDNPKTIDAGGGEGVKFKVSYAGKSGKVAVSGIKINFVMRNNAGDYLKAGVTEGDGTVVCKINKISEVKSGNIIEASPAIELDSIANLGKDYQTYFSTLKNAMDKIRGSYEFTSVSGANQKLPTTVIAMEDAGGSMKEVPALAAQIQSYMISKGYKVVKFKGEDVSLSDLNDADEGALSQISAKGIKRVIVLTVVAESEPEFNETISRYMAIYNVSFQLIDTQSGEVISADSLRITATAANAKGVFNALIQSAGGQIARLID